MVAEKKGIVRMYSTNTLQAFMSLDCGHTPLVSADWSLTNELRVAVIAGTDWFVFDTSHSRSVASVITRGMVHKKYPWIVVSVIFPSIGLCVGHLAAYNVNHYIFVAC